MENLGKWVVKLKVISEIKILNKVDLHDIKLVTSPSEQVLAYPSEESKSLVKKKVKCEKVEFIEIITPEVSKKDAENYALDKGQIVADFIAYCQNKKVE